MSENNDFEKQDFISSILDFINTYKRFPYIKGDKIIINESLLSADKYAKEFFGKQKDMITYFLDNNLINYEIISKMTKMDVKKTEQLVKKQIEKPDPMDRRKIEVFFGIDFYYTEDKYNPLCENCSKKCKQDYWVMVIECPKRKVKK